MSMLNLRQVQHMLAGLCRHQWHADELLSGSHVAQTYAPASVACPISGQNPADMWAKPPLLIGHALHMQTPHARPIPELCQPLAEVSGPQKVTLTCWCGQSWRRAAVQRRRFQTALQQRRREAAAVRIQAWWRGHSARSRLCLMHSSAGRLQAAWKARQQRRRWGGCWQVAGSGQAWGMAQPSSFSGLAQKVAGRAPVSSASCVSAAQLKHNSLRHLQ